jgi:hypothetical protein
MTNAERRERARLRSERWRRAHGIGPRKPAERPLLAMGISRSTYYRRRAGDREQEQVRTDITKEEAARRQLETAIALFFWENDEISVHVLASSAAQILTDVCKAKQIVSFRDMLIEHIKPEYRNWAVPKLKEAYNYFKHAKKDTFDPLSRFHPGMNATLLFGCCHD